MSSERIFWRTIQIVDNDIKLGTIFDEQFDLRIQDFPTYSAWWLYHWNLSVRVKKNFVPSVITSVICYFFDRRV